MLWLAIRGLMFIIGTRKGPLPSAPTVGVLNKYQLVNLYLLRIRPGWCTKGHNVYIGSSRMSLHPVCTNGRERDRSQVYDGKVERMPRAWLLLGCMLSVELILPFIDQRGSRGYRWEKEEKTKGRKGPSRVSGIPFPLSLPC